MEAEYQHRLYLVQTIYKIPIVFKTPKIFQSLYPKVVPKNFDRWTNDDLVDFITTDTQYYQDENGREFRHCTEIIMAALQKIIDGY